MGGILHMLNFGGGFFFLLFMSHRELQCFFLFSYADGEQTSSLNCF